MKAFTAKMSFLIFSLATLFLFLPASPSNAQSGQPDGATFTSFSGSLGIGTEPCCGTGIGFGLGVGTAVYHTNDIEIRVDLTYFNFDGDGFEITRIPFIPSARYYVPQKNKDVDFYVQGGLGLSFDKFKQDRICFGPVCGGGSDSETNIDLVPAAGVLFKVSPSLAIGGEAAFHLTDENYLTLMGRVMIPMGR